MRAPGTGSIDTLPSGRYRGRLPDRRRLPARDTREQAEADLDLAIGLVAKGLHLAPQGTPLYAYGRRVIERRKLDGYSNAQRELSRWSTHVEPSDLGARGVEHATRPDVLAFVRSLSVARVKRGNGHRKHKRRTVSRSVVVDVLRIVRAVFKVAVIEGLREDDPTLGVEIARARGRTHDPWTWLRPGEVVRLLDVAETATVERDLGGLGRGRAVVRLVGDEDRDAAIVALYTGLREGELWCLHVADVDLAAGRLVVRYGGRRGDRLQPTKGRRPRTLVLLTPALEALRRQIERVSSRPNPRGLVFPSASPTHPGAYRAEGRPPRCWSRWLAAAGLTPEERGEPVGLTWHSLRHTFATLALAGRLPGAEGEGWRIERVSAYLGHTSIQVTQRYADVAALL